MYLRQVVCNRIEGTADVSNKEVKGLHIYAPAYDFGYFVCLNPHEIVVVSLEDELFVAQKVSLLLIPWLALKALLFNS